MNYFPPQDLFVLGQWGSARQSFWRLGTYRKWYMSITHRDAKYSARIWTFHSNHGHVTQERHEQDFDNENDAAKWCELTIDTLENDKIIEKFEPCVN